MTLIDKSEALRIVMEECYKDREMKLATRIEERFTALPARGVGVKQLQWKQAGGDIKEGEGFSAWPDLIHTPVTIYRKRDGWWLNLDCKTHPTLEAAKAAAQADYEARILAALAAERAKGANSAMRDILAERARQIEAEGWTPEHDDTHRNREMAVAAGCYAIFAAGTEDGRAATDLPGRYTVDGEPIKAFFAWQDVWPWDRSWWKPTTPRRDLVKAGALILAEIERLDRAAITEAGQ